MSILGAFLQSHPLTLAIVCDVFGMNLFPGGMNPVQWYSLISILFCSGWFIFAIEVGIFKGTQSCPWACTPDYHKFRSTLGFPPALPIFDKSLHVFLIRTSVKINGIQKEMDLFNQTCILRVLARFITQIERKHRFETIGLLYAPKDHV